MGSQATSTNYREASFSDPVRKHSDAHSSGVSWAAVAGGAFVSAALALIMLALGAGFGLSSVSPWSNVGASASTVGTAALIWLVFTELVASAMGGYLAGRLRTKWATIHTDEVYFRDTANGLLSWAVAVVITAAFLASSAAAMVGGSAQMAAAETAGAAKSADPNAYFVDSLFRSDRASLETNNGVNQAEAGRIFANALRLKDIPVADKTYLAQMIAAKTGLSQSDAEKRVSDVIGEARQAMDAARIAAAHVLFWIFLALLVGAFSASLAATWGGRQRDHVVTL
jgi:hypothetical protein